MNKTSVIVPAHNYARYLDECISSVLRGTLLPKEIIVVNDSSNDNTQEIVRSLQDIAPIKIKYFEVAFQHSNKTRNFGFKESFGEYVLFLDADNYLEPQFIERTQEALEADRDSAYAYTDWNWVDMWSKMVGEPMRTADFSYEELKGRNYIDMCSLIRRPVFERFMFDEQQNGYDDWDFWLTLAENGYRGKHVGEPLFNYRRHDESKTYRIVHFNREEIVDRLHRKHNLY